MKIRRLVTTLSGLRRRRKRNGCYKKISMLTQHVSFIIIIIIHLCAGYYN